MDYNIHLNIQYIYWPGKMVVYNNRYETEQNTQHKVK